MDFKSFLKDTHSYNAAFVVIDWLCKQSVSLPYFKTIIVKDMARLYINNIYRFYSAFELIISDHGPQFISNFWNEFCHILKVKIKLFTTFHP